MNNETLTMAITTTTLLLLLTLTVAGDDTLTFIFKGCSNQTLPGGSAALPSLAALSTSLLSLSSTSRFSRSTTTTSPRLSGLFQCRGDLPLPACSACVRRIPSLWTDLCPLSSAARVHLAGCYALYQVAGFPQVSGTSMIYKRCSSEIERSEGFEERRDEAFAKLESAAAAGEGEGFCETRDGGVGTMAQCEGELSVADCGECVAEAVQKAEVECGGSGGGEMYLDKCYVVYGSGARGVLTDGGGGGGGDGGVGGGGGGVSYGGGSYGGYGGSGENTQKTVAIVVGGAAGLGFLVIFVLFFRSLSKKEEF